MPLQLFGTLIKWKGKAICSQGKSKIPGPRYIHIHNCGQVTQDSCSLALCIAFDQCLLPLHLTHKTDLPHACLRLQLATVLIKQVVQFSSVTQSCPTLCDPMNHNTPGLPVHHQLPERTQTHVHRVGDAIQPSHPLSSPSPPAPNPSQHQSLFQ